jgi:cupin superfamily acireductone dioxygenase involved in methionine salvage
MSLLKRRIDKLKTISANTMRHVVIIRDDNMTDQQAKANYLAEHSAIDPELLTEGDWLLIRIVRV